MRRPIFLLAALLATALLTTPPFASSTPAAEPALSRAFPCGDLGQVVEAAAVFDEDGSGGAAPVLFAGGQFTKAGGLPANRIARWDGERWSAVGDGLDGPVYALAVYDPDGAGPASPLLVVGGQFTLAGGDAAANVAAWDGTAWSALGSGTGGAGAVVRALHAWDPDGPGGADPLLVAGGSFDSAGGQPAGGIATWDGSSWAAPGSGTTAAIHAIADYDGDLWIGGDFDQLDGQPIARLARYDGATWTQAGTLTPSSGEVRALLAWDDGGGERLAIGGNFDLVDATVARNVCAWNGSSFHALGSGLGTFNEFVHALAAFDADGSHETLWAGGEFGSDPLSNLARWEGGSWSGVGGVRRRYGTEGRVKALAVFDADDGGPAGARLWIGGYFDWADDAYTSFGGAAWDGSRVVPLGNGMVPTYASGGRLASFDPDGAGPGPGILYAVAGTGAWFGEYRVGSSGVAAWNGGEWTDPGFTADDRVTLLETVDLGIGPVLVATGLFTEIGGVPANHIAKWNGTTWSALGSGIDEIAHAIEAWDPDGAGPGSPLLVVAGWELQNAGGVPVDRIAAWDGDAWSDLGGGYMSYYGVSRLGVYDEDGDGPGTPRLFAGKNFSTYPCQDDDWLLRFEGPGWTSFGTGYGFQVTAIEPYDPDDEGPAPEQLYLPLSFPCFTWENAPAQLVARWNGSFFQDLGLPYLNAEPGALAVLDPDGEGPDNAKLFAYNVTGPDELGLYDGSTWSVIATAGVPSGFLGPYYDLAEHDPDGPGPAPSLLAAIGAYPALEEEATGEIVSCGRIAVWGYDPDAVTSVALDPPQAAGPAPLLAAGRAHPLPARGPTRVRFSLAREGAVRAAVYDVAGRRVRALLDGLLAAGSHSIAWDGLGEGGRPTGSGVYFLRIEAHGESVARRIVRIE